MRDRQLGCSRGTWATLRRSTFRRRGIATVASVDVLVDRHDQIAHRLHSALVRILRTSRSLFERRPCSRSDSRNLGRSVPCLRPVVRTRDKQSRPFDPRRVHRGLWSRPSMSTLRRTPRTDRRTLLSSLVIRGGYSVKAGAKETTARSRGRSRGRSSVGRLSTTLSNARSALVPRRTYEPNVLAVSNA